MPLKTSHIAHSFGKKQVLLGVTFELDKGRVTVLMGTNGSGKTTLLNIISGFLKPISGDVFVDDQSIKNFDSHQINALGITRTFQDMRLIGKLTVKENILLAFKKQRGEQWWSVLFPNKKVDLEQEQNNEKVIELLRKCFIYDIADQLANEISYGQQKLLNLACCIANDADYLLLDEPVAGVNPVYRDKLIELINNLKHEGKAILIIEHNTDFIEEVADEILFLNNGEVKLFDNYTSLKNNTEVQEAYI